MPCNCGSKQKSQEQASATQAKVEEARAVIRQRELAAKQQARDNAKK